jgi:hypothetical protein
VINRRVEEIVINVESNMGIVHPVSLFIVEKSKVKKNKIKGT